MTTKCNPCDCPEQYYRDEHSFRKAVLNLLCRINNMPIGSANFTVGNVSNAPYNFITNDIGLPTGYSAGDNVYYKFYMANQAPNSNDTVVFSSVPFLVGPVNIVDPNNLISFSIITDNIYPDYSFIRVLRRINNGNYDSFIDVNTDFVDTGVLDGGSSGASWAAGNTVTPSSPYSYTPAIAASHHFVETPNASHFNLSHAPIIQGSVTGLFRNALGASVYFQSDTNGVISYISVPYVYYIVGSVNKVTGAVVADFNILSIDYQDSSGSYHTDTPNTSHFTLAHFPIFSVSGGIFRDANNNSLSFDEGNSGGNLTNLVHYEPPVTTPIGTVNFGTGAVASNFNILKVDYYTS